MRLGIDTGGTFTDAVLLDDAGGVLATAKAPTTRHDLAIGIGDALRTLLARPTAADARIGLVAVSTTLATNALVEGHGSPVCLVVIGQDADMLSRARLGLALGDDPVVFVRGGHDATGEEQAPLDAVRAARAIAEHAPRVSAFAVVSHFSVRNPEHELTVKRLVREATGLPVSCSHELTPRLNAPRRALTTLLNARLIALIQHLIEALQATLRAHAIDAPLMVVKGDGSLIAAATALERPVETILSGPAASLVGAHYLSGRDDVVVADVGGTTTDIAVVCGGQPQLDDHGALIGEWPTMVRAVAVQSFGIGGDSQLTLDPAGTLQVGPERAVPLAALAETWPGTLALLDAELEHGASAVAGFALRRPRSGLNEATLSGPERRVWDSVAEAPTPLGRLLHDPRNARPLARLRARGRIQVAAFTPTDAAHVLGLQASWSVAAARAGAEIWVRTKPQLAGSDAADFSRRVIDRVIGQSMEALLGTVLRHDAGVGAEAQGGLRARNDFVSAALAQAARTDSRVAMTIGLRSPVVAVGAPAHLYYPQIARRLNTTAIVPPHAAVANAVGAVAARVIQRVAALISAPARGCFRVHLPSGNVDFTDLEPAAAHATEHAARIAARTARAAGAVSVRVDTTRADCTVDVGGERLFVESRIVATATGQPHREAVAARAPGSEPGHALT